ncbi:hypothetical protein [Crocinitomix catalasitica]|uniref:hypothetical protein n=1 Tax=Crocinitomix catalasitica TaxID=184607 RepID=UPI000907A6C7|nr:hypothetical protein [Crocinitomix catalasitica]
MIKILSTSLLFFSVISHSSSSNESLPVIIEGATVYICYSTTATKYHFTKNCRGLSACTHDIKIVTLQDAKGKYERTLCGWED